MKYRKLTSSGDYVFGQGVGNFTQNSPETVAQAIKTRLQLRQGEWMLDTTIGTPYDASILGAGKLTLYDAAIQDVILNTQGVNNIIEYTSGVDPTTRQATISCTVNTIYGTTQFQVTA